MPKRKIPQEHQLYQVFDVDEEAQRSASHYEQDPQFYFYLTGGEWNVYSSYIWPNEQSTPTQAQEAKLDLLAQEMQLKPGMRILDVGCGWGGPLTYLCKTYGVTGVGIAVSSKQVGAAQARADRYGVNAKFYTTHWENFADTEGFDAIYSDEVIVHFAQLGKFFANCWAMLKMGGMMVHKELHYTHKRHSIMARSGEFVQSVFEFTGNYRLLAEELQLLNDTGFELVHLYQIPVAQYNRTFDYWLHNMFENREAMTALAGATVYNDFRRWIKVICWSLRANNFSLDVVASRKIEPNEQA